MLKTMTVLIALITLASSIAAAIEYNIEVLPPEHKKITDPKTGVELTFLTTNPAKDNNLYFHDRSWLADGSVILFTSSRDGGGLMGYLVQTGELLKFTTRKGKLGGATAAVNGAGFYAIRDGEVLQLTLQIEPSDDLQAGPSKATLTERHICDIPKGASGTALNESCDAKYLSVGLTGGEVGDKPAIFIIDIASGEIRELCCPPDPPGYAYHVQWSHTNPNLLSYAGLKQRLMIVDIRDGIPKNIYKARPNELVTHESWWVDDQMIFCGGLHPYPNEDAHVKVIDVKTGVVRIIGAGAWWPEAEPVDLAKRNWWHADGSDDGQWVVADNWHGDIMLFEASTTRPRLLTAGHRTYGKGDHPHPGFDRASKAVVFTSHMLGGENVCVAEIPENWRAEIRQH